MYVCKAEINLCAIRILYIFHKVFTITKVYCTQNDHTKPNIKKYNTKCAWLHSNLKTQTFTRLPFYRYWWQEN